MITLIAGCACGTVIAIVLILSLRQLRRDPPPAEIET